MRLRIYRREVSTIRELSQAWQALDADAWQARRLRDLRARLMRDGLGSAARLEACAATDVACRQVLELGAFDNQWLAALTMLDGQLAEMATGEGKTLSAGLAAAVAAMAGVPVHVMTANDYLARRDAETWRRSTAGWGCVTARCARATARRRGAAHTAATWCTPRRARSPSTTCATRPAGRARSGAAGADRPARGRPPAPLLRGLHMALIDEADSILLDEARVPLILSVAREDARQRAMLWQTVALADRLEPSRDYLLRAEQRRAELTAAGRERLVAVSAQADGAWINARHRDEMVSTALAARHLYARGQDYFVRDGEIVIIDPVTGRGAEGRQWSLGLHQLIALKEGCKPRSRPKRSTRSPTSASFRAICGSAA